MSLSFHAGDEARNPLEDMRLFKKTMDAVAANPDWKTAKQAFLLILLFLLNERFRSSTLGGTRTVSRAARLRPSPAPTSPSLPATLE